MGQGYIGQDIFNGRNRVYNWDAPYKSLRYNGVGEHRGVDIDGIDTLVVRATIGGTVVTARNKDSDDLGLYVKIHAGDGKYYFYCHLYACLVNVGDVVVTGAPIGIMGKSGNARTTYKHVHYQVSITGSIYSYTYPEDIISPNVYTLNTTMGAPLDNTDKYWNSYFRFNPKSLNVLSDRQTYYQTQSFANPLGTITSGLYLVVGGPVTSGGYSWYTIYINGGNYFVPIQGTNATIVYESVDSSLPTDRVPDEWVQQRKRDADVLEAQQAAFESQAADMERQQAAAEARERAEVAARQVAEDKVRAKEAVVDTLVVTTTAKLDAHRQQTLAELAALWAESDEKLRLASDAIREIMNALQVWAMARVAALHAKADRARNPVNGRLERMEALVEALFDKHRQGAIQAGEYGMLYLTGPQYDSYDMTAFVYDTRAREILWELLEQYLSYSLSAREYHDLQMSARLFDVHGLTVRQYDTSAKLYYQ